MGERLVSRPDWFPGCVPGPDGVLVHRLPRGHRARPAPGPPSGPAGARRRPHAARHDDRRRDLRRRRPHGRRPAGDHGQPDLAARHREGLPGRQLQRHRHRRGRRHRHRDGEALPGRARALREDRGPDAQPRRQGQPAGADDPRQPRRRPAGPGRRPPVRRVRPRRRRGHRPGPDLQLRRHRRELRAARLRGRRLPLAVRAELAEEDLAARSRRRHRAALPGGGAVRRRRRRLRHRRPRSRPAALPDRLPGRRRGRRPAGRRRGGRRRRGDHRRARRARRAGLTAMTMPYYASPEQLMRDRSEYARKGISRGRSVAVLTYSDGVLFIAENPSSTLHKVGELYDRIGFAAVGRYSEFESLRVAGVRLADVRGYSYNRRDVTGRVIANAYAQTLGEIFTQQTKPYEVELCVAEVGATPEADQLFRLTFDGSIVDEPDFVVMGGQADAVTGHLREHFLPGMGLADALKVGVRALSAVSPVTAGAGNGGPSQLTSEQLEVAVLDRRRPKRAFRRVVGAALRGLLGEEGGEPEAKEDEATTGTHVPSTPQPGTPAGLGDPAAPDTAGRTDVGPEDSGD